jgi:hypothetical protein
MNAKTETTGSSGNNSNRDRIKWLLIEVFCIVFIIVFFIILYKR